MSAPAWCSVSSFGHPVGETDFDRHLERVWMSADEPATALQDAVRAAVAWARVLTTIREETQHAE